LAKIREWCDSITIKVNAHSLSYFEADATKLSTAVANVAAIVPGHYTAAARVAGILKKLGKPAAAKYVAEKLPSGPRSRSGDIGEMLASSWVSDFTVYKIGVLKLRWKDHREMAMRGDDILAVCLDPALKIRFLKGEAKSRASLTKKTVEEARTALLSSSGRPTPHALAFVSDRLFEAGENELADLIDQCQLKKRIKIDQLSHLMFMFTGNNSRKLLAADLVAYKGRIRQYAVGLRVPTHQTFISKVFKRVIADANKP
jgi:Cap4 SAVED domain